MNPLANPVLIREFLTSLRTRRALWLALVFLGVLAGLVVLMWPAEGVFSLAAQASHKLFIVLSMVFLALVVLCAPSFTAVSITSEKERQTYDMLYDTLLRPDEIVLGKLVAGVGFVLILIVGSLPMMGTCFILGGVALGDVGKVYLVVVAAAVFFGLLGLYCSATFRSSYRSLILCYVFILILCGLTWVPTIVIGGFSWTIHHTHIVRALSPFAAMIAVVHPGLFSAEHDVVLPAASYGGLADSPWVFLVLAAAGSVALLAVTLRKIARPPQPRGRADTAIIDERMELMKRHVKFPFYLIDPRKRKRMIGPLINLIAVKEMRAKAFGRATWMLRMIMGLLIISLPLAFLPLTQLHLTGIDRIVYICLSLPLGIIILISPVLTASAVSEELESGVFDMLRCTPVSARTFVMGKIEVSWFFIILLILSTFPTFFVLAYVSSSPTDMQHISKGVNLIRPFNFQFTAGWAELKEVNLEFIWDMGSAFGVVAVSMFYATVTGLAASAFFRRSSTATAVAYLAIVVVAVGTLIPYFIADSLPHRLVEIFLTLNPFAAAARAVSPTALAGWDFSWLQHVYLLGGLSIVLLVATMLRVQLMMRPQR